ncbi:hypothetical protein Hanom_Chr16g01463441 [Helianthus anomalus]
MKVKTGNKPVPRAPKVCSEFVLNIFRLEKFGTDTQYHLFISDHGFHTNNFITIQLFC